MKMYTSKEEQVWSYILSLLVVASVVLTTVILLTSQLYGSSLNNMNFKFMNMNKVDPKANIVFKAECDKVLKNIDGYICYSYKEKGPLFNVYAIDERVFKGNFKKRLKFMDDKRIPEEYRSNIQCFKHNDEDLGHLLPDADADYNKKVLFEAYLMSNIVPQPSNINRNIISKWEGLERDLTFTGTVVVITGVDYYKNRYLNCNKECTKLPKGYYKVFFIYDSLLKHYNPLLVLYVNRKETVYKITSKTKIFNFLRKRKIYFMATMNSTRM